MPEPNKHQDEDDKWDEWDKRIRDAILFTIGIGGVIHELFIIAEPRLYALMFLGGIIGVPFVLSADEKKNKHG